MTSDVYNPFTHLFWFIPHQLYCFKNVLFFSLKIDDPVYSPFKISYFRLLTLADNNFSITISNEKL